jgi:hypothetical protein
MVGVSLAFLASAAGTPGAYDHYRFFAHDTLRGGEEEQVRNTIKFFSSTLAGFYALGGATADGLNLFPAEKMIKRRTFQDIENWKVRGKLLVMDRDRSVVREVRFIAPDRAVAVVDENWFSQYQDRKSRQEEADKIANFITVRYFLRMVGGKWMVVEYAVYPQGEPLPPFPLQSVAKW